MLRFTAIPAASRCGERDDRARPAGPDARSRRPMARSDARLRSSRTAVSSSRRCPAVDDLVARLQAAPIDERARAVQDAYLDAHGRAAARAGIFRLLLYIAALALVGLCRLPVPPAPRQRPDPAERLALREADRLDLHAVHQSAARPHRRGHRDGLARLAEHAGVDRAHIVVRAADESARRALVFLAPQRHREPDAASEDLLELARALAPPDYERYGCIHVPRVAALPDGPEKARLQAARRPLMAFASRSAQPASGSAFSCLRPLTREALARRRHRAAAHGRRNLRQRDRARAQRDRARGARGAAAPGAAAGGDRNARRRHRARVQQHSRRHPRLRRNGARCRCAERRRAAPRRADHEGGGARAGRHRPGPRLQPPPRAASTGRCGPQPVVAEAVELIRASLPATVTRRDAPRGRRAPRCWATRPSCSRS